MELTIDHVTVAGRDLDALARAFSDAGLSVEYGGRHSNGATHMSVVGFPDGSYVELISTVESATRAPWWHAPIRGDGGPCAWAVSVDDIEAASETLRARGVAVDGPVLHQRERDDGTLVEWDISELGGGDDPGETLPFLISDRTPRELRVEPTVDRSPHVGIDTVILGVTDLDVAVERFEAAFSLGTPERDVLDQFDADVAVFPDAPVAVAAPRGDGWLADRLDRFGPRPVAYLLGVDSGGLSAVDVGATDELAGREVGWASPAAPVGRRYLGVVEAEQ